ncbi:hypothetical protein HELRODRAFT_171263 [Helobdella robusta]|uniref:DUF659 domain-containing protein n=1 Tax=Helobdella robusta TaxID=6412 RepID=T1F403_HELRO|nr:hypothetical protein HELRODRAFT_171263 [Helobdella robusta]ESO05609.1 hypothetical protein HELRODRAFT_171263 [Helobdella robusta]
MPKTRKELFCEVFGLPTDLLGNVLPTNSDVMKCYLWNRNLLKETVRGLYFDGRKDKTIQQDKKGTKYYRSTVTEEHVVLLSEPGSLFLGHVSPMSGSAKNITLSIKTFLKDADSNINELKAIGCDGTVINTGLTNGVIRQLELFIGRPLQWHICLLHTNELPLRHLIQFLDGKTSNPRCFSGEIGKMLENCEKLSIAAFEPIETELPSIHQNDLSTDQTYLFDIRNRIMKGDIPLSLSLRNPGKMSHSRWITTANRILRLYVAVQNPSTALKVLAQYVMKVYPPSWFEIKLKPTNKTGSNHFLGIIKKCRYLPEELKNLLNPVLQRNAYFAHPENILLSMLADEQKHIRELALRRILKCRANDATLNTVRVFKVPKLNFDAINYYDMIDWHATEITEPPLTKDITTEALEQMIMDIPNNIEFLKLPCHTQAVERMIKLVTEASLSVCGEKARDGFIRTKLASQNDIPKFETKKHFII